MKDLKNFIDNDIFVDKLPMRKRIKPNLNRYEYDTYYPDYSSEGRKFYNYLERYIKSNVGRSYNKAFSKFCDKMKTTKEYSKILWGEILQKRFESYFTGRYPKFYVENGIIKEHVYRHKNKPKPVIVQSYPIEYYKFPEEELKNLPWLESVMNETLGKDKTRHYLYDRITPEEYSNLGSYYHEYTWKQPVGIYKLNGKLRDYKHDRYSSWSFHDILNKFKAYGIPDVTAGPGTKEFERDHYERLDASKKCRRESKRNKKIYAENLLHEMAEKEKERKHKEEEADRLLKLKKGFDDDSFVGEFYHGQKRKKKNETVGN